MKASNVRAEIAIVGGGLSGLALADHLNLAGLDFQLFEARERFGGRILSHPSSDFAFDLGPSWFWPGQERMAALIARFRLPFFEQHAAGDIIFEDETGRAQRGMGIASMQGSLRLDGGMQVLVKALLAQLPQDRLHLGKEALKVSADEGLLFADGTSCAARHIVLALPPRVSAKLHFEPALSGEQLSTLQSVPTWMAPHAKFIAIYEDAFWRAEGLSGDAMSRRGPLAEIHDASASSGSPAALFGFLGVPAPQRAGNSAEIGKLALDQFANLFGPQAGVPIETVLYDWAQEPFTSTHSDLVSPPHHPAYTLPNCILDVWNGKLHFCSTELATESGGLLEGALSASETLARRLNALR